MLRIVKDPILNENFLLCRKEVLNNPIICETNLRLFSRLKLFIPFGVVRIYQYNEDDYWAKFRFLQSFQTTWIHIKMETKRINTFSLFLERFLEIKTYKEMSSSLYWYKRQLLYLPGCGNSFLYNWVWSYLWSWEERHRHCTSQVQYR